MSDIFEKTEEANKTEWQNNKEMNPMVNSSVTDEGLLESGGQEGDKNWRKDKDDEPTDFSPEVEED